MIRLPSSHAAITAPLVASSTAFPGIHIGRSLLDGRPFHLSPVLTDDAILPSTNSLALGGLGSGKSTTAKSRIRREILHHDHQAVVIDSFGENATGGEWAPLTRSLGGRVIEASSFTLNPVSALFPPPVREQLVRSLIAAVEPGALNHQATHALQHALNHPKAGSLNGLVDALVAPEEGRWPIAKLAEWGEGAAIALSRYTEGSLSGLFDGQDASLPETDLPILSFDFSRLDRNSPAIPSLMAAVACWTEHVWLRQSTAPHRHLVVEEAWQILLSPATSELIQRLLKYSRRTGLSMDVVMHTLSDLGEGRAQDLARLCEIAHVGRLGPEEAALVGALLGLPDWAIQMIPTLAPGQAVWKVGPDYVDVIETVRSAEEAELTDTSARRRKAQQAVVADEDLAADPTAADDEDQEHDDIDKNLEVLGEPSPPPAASGDWTFEMPPNVVDTRHDDVLQAAREGRRGEAAELAAFWEHQDISAHGIHSDEAASWLTTRARVADLCGEPHKAAHLRATVTRMGKDPGWWTEETSDEGAPEWYRGPQPPATSPAPVSPPEAAPAVDEGGGPVKTSRRRTLTFVAAVAALGITGAGVWQHAEHEQHITDRKAKAAAYKGRSGASLHIDGVNADVVAHWTSDADHVIVELRSYFDENAKYLHLEGGGKSASTVKKNGYYPLTPEINLPVTDPLADVTVRIQVGGKDWTKGSPAAARTVRLSPTGVAYDPETGEQLPSDL